MDGDCVGRGRGNTKKAAKNEAAKEGLAKLGVHVVRPSFDTSPRATSVDQGSRPHRRPLVPFFSHPLHSPLALRYAVHSEPYTVSRTATDKM